MFRTCLVLSCVLLSPRIARAEGMYKIKVANVTAQDVGDDDQPTGKPRPVKDRANATISCRLADDPKTTVFEVWRQGSVDDSGRFLMTHSKGGGPDDVVSCAGQAFANMKVASKAGTYRVSAKVSFTKAR